ncbi:MAG: hypothetical protein DRQ63_00505 [Gammaproteobacteria bacterium]|nr:MAG: hypothetical protein DRQ63_00505 [Gammaproteobacteria bacterium]
MADRGLDHWFLQIPGWLLLTYLVYAQAIPAFDYELGVRMGTQESAQKITEVGAAFWYGFAFSDLVVYIPLLATGLIGNWRGRPWGRVIFGAALGITVYWPVVVLAATVDARDASGWTIDEAPYWVVLPIITAWALWGLLHTACVARDISVVNH